MSPVPGLHDVRSSLRSKIRSIPRVYRSSYLDLHMLSREKERLEKELDQLKQKQRRAEQRLVEIYEQMEQLAPPRGEQESKEGGSGQSMVSGKGEGWRVVKVGY